MSSIVGTDIAGSLMISEGSAGLLSLLRRLPEILLVTPCLRGKSAVESARILKKRDADAQIVLLYLIGAGTLDCQDPNQKEPPLRRGEGMGTPQNKDLGSRKDLTERERQIMECLAHGGRYLDVAGQLNISYETVKSHFKNICRKLGVRSRIEAVAKYYKLVSPATPAPISSPELVKTRENAKIPVSG
jgi:DNA-binding CsgD family transcriptional regulator